MADSTTGGLPVVKVDTLPPAYEIYDEFLLPGEFQGEALYISGRKLKDYTAAGAKRYQEESGGFAEAAKKSAEAAAGSAVKAAGSAGEAAESADKAEQYSGKPPIIQNGTWRTWNADSQRYEDTGEAARGNLMFASFWLDPLTGELYMYTDDEYAGPQFRLNENNLEVLINAGYRS